LNPSADNPDGHASGLVQIMPQFLSGLGFKGTAKDFRETSAAQQLTFVEKIINNLSRINGGPLTSAAQYYVGNFLPVALQLPGVKQNIPSTIIVSANPTQPHLPHVSIEQEQSYYNHNKGLDFDHDGNITFGDIQKVLERAKSKPSYQNAVSDLNKFRNGDQSEFMGSKHTVEDSSPKNIDTLLSKYLSIVNSENKMYKKYLPYNTSVIKITANNTNEALEFARILSLALDEELSAKVSTHLNDGLVEVECDVAGPQKESFLVVEQFSNSLAEVFFDVTKKIGGISVKTQTVTNKKSSYKPVNLKTAESEHRKFLLKFI
jgi:hypothetical protein